MMNAKLDNPFEEDAVGFIDFITLKIMTFLKKPTNFVWSIGTLVTVTFVFSNALFFQNQSHPSVFFETRDASNAHRLQADELNLPIIANQPSVQQLPSEEKPVTRIVFDPNVPTATQKKTLPKVANRPAMAENGVIEKAEKNNESDLEELQGLLAQLGYYDGKIDGLSGPKTKSAIEAYKKNVGLHGIDLDYGELSTSARNNLIVTAAVPKTRPSESASSALPPKKVETIRYTPPVTSNAESVKADSKEQILKVQAGLRAFGNDSVNVDGLPGSQTEAAIKEFQSLFKLPITGKIDESLITKMTAVGLIN